MPQNNSLIARYTLSAAQTQQLSAETLTQLQKLSVAPNPVHYTLLFEYLGEIDPEVKEELETALQLRTYGDDVADELYQRLLHKILSQVLPLEDTEALLQQFNETVSLWQTTFSNEQNALRTDIDRLKQALSDTPQAATLLEKVILPRLDRLEQQTQTLTEAINHFNRQFEKVHLRFSSDRVEARTDPLSGLLNRRGLMEKLQEIIHAATENGQTFSAILLDIDFFKKINDTYGHVVGDSAIRYLARILKNETKGQDLVARIGGEEFVIILPGTPYDSAMHVAENIRRKVEQKVLSVRFKNQPLRFTLSAGIAVYQIDEPIEELFERADKALYLAKARGRNKVVGEGAL